MQSDIAAIPFPEFRLSYWRELSFAPDEGAASRGAEIPNGILIIEDDVLIASQIEATLTDAGFEIIGVTASGDEALELAKKRPPTFAVIDIRLSGDRDGVDTAIELFRCHGVRCIFASAYSDEEARLRAESAAPLGWLQKPYTMGSLRAMVHNAAGELRKKR